MIPGLTVKVEGCALTIIARGPSFPFSSLVAFFPAGLAGSRSSTSKTITIKRLPPSLLSYSKNATLSKVYTGDGSVGEVGVGDVSLSRLTWIVAGICVFIAAILVLVITLALHKRERIAYSPPPGMQQPPLHPAASAAARHHHHFVNAADVAAAIEKSADADGSAALYGIATSIGGGGGVLGVSTAAMDGFHSHAPPLHHPEALLSPASSSSAAVAATFADFQRGGGSCDFSPPTYVTTSASGTLAPYMVSLIFLRFIYRSVKL